VVGCDIGANNPIGGATIDGVTAGGGGISPFLDLAGVLVDGYEGTEMLNGIGDGDSPLES